MIDLIATLVAVFLPLFFLWLFRRTPIGSPFFKLDGTMHKLCVECGGAATNNFNGTDYCPSHLQKAINSELKKGLTPSEALSYEEDELRKTNV